MFRYMLVASAFLACAYAAATYNQDAGAYITKSDADITPEGNYNYAYETSNGIAAQESGIGGNHATGGYSYYSPEGELVQISYVADENGYQPQGALLPTPPPIPAAILRSLEYIRTRPQTVIQDGRIGTRRTIYG
ncbi:pupal cuticle protein Edg-78E-like isoform X2 [Drosophila rhopaloa]|uniref:Pupal cuticle protein Edg-78E-like n=1 Tax=Drosophila rhopaloa TaxID=1041015 RepID=A0A6P4FN65_DRORH|nr:pupal cuticle protein Edg-78E-like isoform X1 [Drosophila rhopaloa]XP_044313757.1 pupal cuticle protein Edg-78E-like isoform X2 [Drosophila rhopaloa]